MRKTTSRFRLLSLFLVLCLLLSSLCLFAYAEGTEKQDVRTSLFDSSSYYYINHLSTGHFLRNNSGTATGESGQISTTVSSNKLYQPSVSWQIRYIAGEDAYTLYPLNASSGDLLLAMLSDGTIGLYSTNNTDEIPTRCLWDITVTTNGYVLDNLYQEDVGIISSTEHHYLKDTGSSLSTSSSVSSANTFRILNRSNYLEWSNSFTADTAYGTTGNAVTLSVNPNNRTWADISDFTFSVADNKATINNNAHTIVPAYVGTFQVTITHKVTALTKNFTISATAGIYGSQSYRNMEGSNNNTNVNCHGYAMMRNDSPLYLSAFLNAYFGSIKDEYDNDPDFYLSEMSSYLKTIFENWLNIEGYTWTYESTFVGNGTNSALSSNQYRIVMRLGLDPDANVPFDYHFWYQTCDGRWADKHGSYESEWLPSNVNPSSTNTTGWDLDGYSNYYDGPIYCYIITTGGTS